MSSIRSILDQMSRTPAIKLFSIDIFDTLVFRTVRTPQDVFELMHQNSPELFPSGFDKIEWRNIRVRTEMETRQRKHAQCGSHREVTLQEIYRGLPLRFTKPEELLQCELEIEHEVCFLNPQILDLVHEVIKHGDPRIVLTSDMYLTRDQIRNLLGHVGFPLQALADVFMSCEHQASKTDGGLFRRILHQYRIAPHEVLHIGDNILADVAGPGVLGIPTIHYDLISNGEIRHPFLELESLKFGPVLPEVHALRLLAADRDKSEFEFVATDGKGKRKKQTEKAPEDPWHALGAMILGPLFTFLAEWVLDIAEENDIQNIYPLMREGEFLSRLLQAAAQHRDRPFNITPLFVSRKALFLPSVTSGRYTAEEVDYLLNSHDIKIQDVFNILELDGRMSPFQECLHVTMAEARKKRLGNATVSCNLKDYLLGNEVQEHVQAKSQEASEVFADYLASSGFETPAISLDLGCSGRTQLRLENALRAAGKTGSIIHLIIIGKEQTLPVLMNNVDLRGFVGTCGKSRELIEQLLTQMLEHFLMCETGTTIGYARIEGQTEPLLEKIFYPNRDQLNQVRQLQNGALAFQQEYFATGLCQKRVREIINKPNELLKPVVRLLSAPLPKEAHMLGNWHHDENFGARHFWKMIDHGQAERLGQVGLEQFLTEQRDRNFEWIPGMLVMNDPYYFLKRLHGDRNSFHKLQRVLYAEKIIRECASEPSIVIAGAGEAGRDLYSYLLIANQTLSVEAFTDNNPNLHGISIQGIPVRAITESFASRCYVIGSLEYATEISQQIRQIKGPDVRIIDFWS